MSKDLILIGCNGNSWDIIEALAALNRQGRSEYRVKGFLDDDSGKWNRSYLDIPVLGGLKKAIDYPQCYFMLAIGSTNTFTKREVYLNTLCLLYTSDAADE